MIALGLSNCLTWIFQFFTSIWNLLDSNYLVTGVSFVGAMIVFYILYMIVDRFYPKG